MRSLFNIKNHLKISICLLILLVSILLTSLFEKQNLKEIDNNFSSIFDDRLVPATDIFFIADQLYERRLKLQYLILSTENKDVYSTTQTIHEQNHFIDSLLSKFEGTYLVESEEVCLKGLNKKWKAYKSNEAHILKLAYNDENDEAKLIFNNEGNILFRSIIKDLHLLTNIQSEVGKDLVGTSKLSISSTNALFSLQTGIVIIVALLCIVFLFASKVIQQPNQKFHLN